MLSYLLYFVVEVALSAVSHSEEMLDEVFTGLGFPRPALSADDAALRQSQANERSVRLLRNLEDVRG